MDISYGRKDTFPQSEASIRHVLQTNEDVRAQ